MQPAKPKRTLGRSLVLAAVVTYLAFQVLRLVTSPTHGINLFEFLTIVVFVVGGLWLTGVILTQRTRAGHDIIRVGNPHVLLVNAQRSIALRTVAKMYLTPVKIRTWLVWAIDDTGVSLWQGGAHPVLAFHLPWTRILAVEETWVADSLRTFPAIAFVFSGPDGQPLSLPFTLGAKNIMFAAGWATVHSTYTEIQARNPKADAAHEA